MPNDQTTSETDDLRHMMEDAVRRHQTGDLDGAAARYCRVLDVAPEAPYAHPLLGVVAAQKDDPRSRRSTTSQERLPSIPPIRRFT
jgi:hypothetical protein